MKKLNLIILLSAVAFVVMAFSYDQGGQSYKYMIMTQHGSILTMNPSSQTYERISIKDEMDKDPNDFGPSLRRLEKYESEGWELVNNEYDQASGVPRNYFLLRKAK